MKAFLEALKPDVELAEKHNSYLAIENHGGALLDSIDSIKVFADLNKNPRLGIALAPYHIQALKAVGGDAILACGPQLLFFYAWQNAPGLGQLPGHGPADFTPWIAALAKIDYKWYVNPFLHNEPAPDGDVRRAGEGAGLLEAVLREGVAAGLARAGWGSRFSRGTCAAQWQAQPGAAVPQGGWATGMSPWQAARCL